MLLIALCVPEPVHAVRVDDLYAAEVDDTGSLDAMFAEALGIVLVKVSGVPALVEPAARRQLVPDAAPLVNKYGRPAEGRLRVEFDRAAVRARLDAAGQPVWGAERPLVALWFALDRGDGRRLILPAATDDASGEDEFEPLRTALLDSAERRGLPVVLPLLDTEDMAGVEFADLWGGFRERVLAASERYGAQGILVGRARGPEPEQPLEQARVRWTLVVPGMSEASWSWEGPAAAGPARAAEYLAGELATLADSAGTLRLQVGRLDSLERFGRVRNYLLSLNVVESAAVVRIENDRVEFDLAVRGDAERLRASLDSGSVLEGAPAGNPAAAPSGVSRLPDLVYQWPAGR